MPLKDVNLQDADQMLSVIWSTGAEEGKQQFINDVLLSICKAWIWHFSGTEHKSRRGKASIRLN
jgi:hypothetical protein